MIITFTLDIHDGDVTALEFAAALDKMLDRYKGELAPINTQQPPLATSVSLDIPTRYKGAFILDFTNELHKLSKTLTLKWL